MHHVNVVVLYYYFFALSGGDNYLNLIQEFVPQTLSRLIKHHWRIRQAIPLASVKLYSFQLLRGLAYIHHRAVCHRDIKPQNLLINPEQGTLKICDFGSAKILNPEEPNVSYICSRYYRAPELIFGATHYTVSIDMWSAGCVIGELLLGRPVFPGSSGVDQLVEIIKILGTPTPEQVREMNPDYSEFKFPNINGCSWEKLIRNRSSESAFPVLRRLLIYSPRIRATASNILADPFFADLIFPPPGHPPNATGHLPNGKPAPQFPSEFTESEMEYLPESLVSRIRHFQNAAAEVSRKSNEARERSSSSQSSPEAINRMQGKNPRESQSDTLRPLQLTTGKHCSACLRTSGSAISRSQTRSMAMSAVDVRAKPVVLRYNQRSARRADNRLSESVDFEATTRTAVARRVETSLSTRPHRSVSYLSQSFHPGALSENAFQSPQRPKSRNAQSNRVSVFGSSFSHKNENG
ncbi:unnamed protein product [Calicophoron daubneyi]|uniref:Protein kinase domain-containing protein n=1 Tax=Calicophoron daubneyi TaxID=300641 RepID=A0AAV2SYC7_CALDB